MNILDAIEELRSMGFAAVINTRPPQYRVVVFPLDNADLEIGPIHAETLEDAMQQALVAAKNWANWVELRYQLQTRP